MLQTLLVHWTAQLDPVAFTIFGRDVAWYGIIITSSLLIALWVASKKVKYVGLTADHLLEFFICIVPVAILGARLIYVVMRPAEYFVIRNFMDFIEIFAIWDGGVSIMGAVPFAAGMAWLWCRWRKIDFATLVDVLFPAVLLGQCIGRWGNFFNQEIYGAPVLNASQQWFPFAVYIDGLHAAVPGWYQAAFFYESLMTGIAFFAVLFVTNRLRIRWGGTLCYLFSYGTIRFFMEFVRDNQGLTAGTIISQVFCALLALGSAGLLAWLIYKDVKAGKKVWYKDKVPPALYPDAKLAVAAATATAEPAKDAPKADAKNEKPQDKKDKK